MVICLLGCPFPNDLEMTYCTAGGSPCYSHTLRNRPPRSYHHGPFSIVDFLRQSCGLSQGGRRWSISPSNLHLHHNLCLAGALAYLTVARQASGNGQPKVKIR